MPAATTTSLQSLRDAFLRHAHGKNASGESIHPEALLKSSYEQEVNRINSDLKKQQQYQGGMVLLPSLYLRSNNPATQEVLRSLYNTSKSFELNLRFKEIERLDEMHAKLWELLSEGGRTYITLEEYQIILEKFKSWSMAREAEKAERVTSSGGQGHAAPYEDMTRAPQRQTPLPESRQGSGGGAALQGEEFYLDNDLTQREDGAPPAFSGVNRAIKLTPEQAPITPQSTSRQSFSNSARHILSPSCEKNAQRAMNEFTTLGNALYLPHVPLPQPTLELFLSCRRSAMQPGSVDISAVYQLFAKKVSLVKCEAELIMSDVNNDDRLTEDEMENYVRDLAPRITALRTMSDNVLPFYCCTATRRIFWDLDPGNHSVVRVDKLLQSSVMDEWVCLQLLAEDSPRNWFGAMATQQLYEKFLLLDTRNVGTLNAANLKQYKKGLPTVLDDGLPHNVSPLSSLFVDRYFETNTVLPKAEIDYRKFVDFVIAVEMLPECSRPAFLWNILDLNGCGVLTPVVANYFFRETSAKLRLVGVETPSIETVVQEAFDLINCAEPLSITREEFIRAPQAGLFTALLVDCLSFWMYENREQR